MPELPQIVHILFAVLGSFRLTELITMDRISEPFRKRFPGYFWSCARCVSVWSGIACTLSFIYLPWLNWPLALSYLFFIKWDWKSRAQADKKNRIQAEVERLAIQEFQRSKKLIGL